MRFEVQTPQGRFEITLPDGTPEDQIEPLIGRALAAQQPAATSQAPAERPGLARQAVNIAGQFGAGANRRLTEVAGALPNLYDAGLQMVGLPRLFGNETQTATQRMQAALASAIGEAPAPQGTAETLARGAGSGLVDAATIALPAAAAMRATAPAAGAAPSLTNRAATALAAQPGLQAASGMVGGAVGEATDSPLAGAAAAFATPLALGAAQRAVTPVANVNSPQRQALVDAARREGIPLTAGQQTGSRFLQNVEAQLEQLPLSAGPQRMLREESERAFTRAALRRAGVDADNTLPETLNTARDRIGGTIGAIANRNVLEVTPQLDGALAQVDDSLRFLPGEVAAPIRARLEQIRGMVVQSADGSPPTIPGASYRMIDSQLGRSIRSTTNGDLRAALTDIRETLRNAMDDSITRRGNPQDVTDWQEARRQYANLMTVANAAGRAGAGAAEGRLSPLALREAVNQSTGRNYAFGRGDLNELARIGQTVLRPPPDSNTAGRTMAQNLLTGALPTLGAGAGAGATGTPAGAMAGAAASFVLPRAVQMLMNSSAGQAYLTNQIAPNPALTQRLAAALLAQQGNSYLVNRANELAAR